MSVVTFLLALGLALRLTLLVTDDEITRPVREFLFIRAHPTSTNHHKSVYAWFSYLVGCPWCTGVWMSAASFIFAAVAPSVFLWVAAAGTASWLVGMAAILTHWAKGE